MDLLSIDILKAEATTTLDIVLPHKDKTMAKLSGRSADDQFIASNQTYKPIINIDA